MAVDKEKKKGLSRLNIDTSGITEAMQPNIKTAVERPRQLLQDPVDLENQYLQQADEMTDNTAGRTLKGLWKGGVQAAQAAGGAIKENVIDPTVDWAKEGHEHIMAGRTDKTWFDEALIGATPMLLAALTGDFETGAEFAGQGLLNYEKRQHDDAIRLQKAKDKVSKDKPLTTSNIAKVETPQGSKYVRVEDAIGMTPAATPTDFNLEEKKNLKKYEHELDAKIKGLPQNKQVDALRKEVNNHKITKSTVAISQAFDKVSQAYKTHNPQTDLAMTFAFMKMLDEGSVVRESEQITARKARSPIEAMHQLQEWFEEGNTLGETQRGKMYSTAKDVYDAQQASQSRINNFYSNIARKRGLDTSELLPPVLSTKVKGFKVKAKSIDDIPEGKKIKQNGKIYIKKDGKMVEVK